MQGYDLATQDLRGLNSALHALEPGTNLTDWVIENPRGAHAIAAGVNAPVNITVKGSTGYYCGGMNQQATIHVMGSVGPGVGENMMSGKIVIEGDAGQYAGATGHGGTLIIRGNSSSRCGISMKGINILVQGGVGHMSAFMGQTGDLVICGDATDALGDSLYEARIFVKGKVRSLGADCIEKEVRPEHIEALAKHIEFGELRGVKPEDFRRYGSARKLYNFNIDNLDAY